MPAEESQTELIGPFVNVSGYRFVQLDNVPVLQAQMLTAFKEIGVKGTILLADEGINIALTGTSEQIRAARSWFEAEPHFKNLWLKESVSDIRPFSKLKIRHRPEIITFQPNHPNPVSPLDNPAPNIEPEKLQEWLDNNADFTLLDTRNTYEIESGTFKQATDLQLENFRDFTTAVETALENGTLNREQPIVTFCTGGIRCEKAAPFLIEKGFSEVYQVEGGILNYFEKCGGEHWQGDCFVFDDRAEINTELAPTGARMCEDCSRAVAPGKICVCGATADV